MYKEIGKIEGINFGFGGYDDAMIGVSFTLGSRKESWGVGDFKGTWANWHKSCQWTEADQVKTWGETVKFIRDLLVKAHKKEIHELVGVPVEVTFDNTRRLSSWRILEEVI